ncbi:MAG: hypothetical protein M1822_007622 [Bathelium mastoideum]|nr:MAG: hypothetical protein M1822_007622 [Bathelium mastoideum]
MSTFTLPNSSPPCPVKLVPELSQEQLLSFPAFKTWISTFQHSLARQQSKDHTFHTSPYKLNSIDIQTVDFFGGGRLGFVKLKADVSNDKGEKLPGSVFLRGGSVGMMLILQPEDVVEGSEEEKYVILTLQPRIPAGSLSMVELPAGMLDDSGTFSGGAAKEIKEETGLEVPESQLIDLTKLALSDVDQKSGEQLQNATYSSPGGTDEFLPLFLHQRRVPRSQLKELQGKLTGLRDHREKITLKIVPLDEVWREGARDAKTLSALALYQGLKLKGEL